MGIKNNGGNWEEADVSWGNQERLHTKTYPNSSGYANGKGGNTGNESIATSGNVRTGRDFGGGLPDAAGGIASHLIEDYEEQMAYNAQEIGRLHQRNKGLEARIAELKKIQQEIRSRAEKGECDN